MQPGTSTCTDYCPTGYKNDDVLNKCEAPPGDLLFEVNLVNNFATENYEFGFITIC